MKICYADFFIVNLMERCLESHITYRSFYILQPFYLQYEKLFTIYCPYNIRF